MRPLRQASRSTEQEKVQWETDTPSPELGTVGSNMRLEFRDRVQNPSRELTQLNGHDINPGKPTVNSRHHNSANMSVSL